MLKNVPLKNPKPNAGEFIETLLGQKQNAGTPLVEYIVNDPVMKSVVTDLLGRTWIDFAEDRNLQKKYLDNFIEFWYRMGYDAVRFERGLPFPIHRIETRDMVAGATEQRAWVDEHHGAIASWEDFERYPWPKLEEYDFFPFEYVNDHLPEGMGLLTSHAGGVFEHLSMILSLEGLSYALYDNPDLVQAITDKLGELMTGFYRHLLDLDKVIAIFPGDDMGYRTGTLISPDALKKYCLPWHKRFSQMTHDKSLPYFLHSCGNIEAIMDHLINEIRIDGKHSFENVIMLVEEFQQRYGDRIAVLGGMDVDFLATATPDDIRRKTRSVIQTCGARGRFAIGSGNSIPSYIPVANYLAMVDEALS